MQLHETYQELSKTIDQTRLAILSLTIPDLLFSTTRQAHSIVYVHRNALI